MAPHFGFAVSGLVAGGFTLRETGVLMYEWMGVLNFVSATPTPLSGEEPWSHRRWRR